MEDSNTKICTKCGASKPLTDFYKSSLYAGGYNTRCKKCLLNYMKVSKEYDGVNPQRKNKDHRHLGLKGNELRKHIALVNNYGFGLSVLEQRYIDQNKQCAICKMKHENLNDLSVDHDHTTGKYRGLLCQNCNSGLGMFRDNIDTLSIAVSYLQTFQKTLL